MEDKQFRASLIRALTTLGGGVIAVAVLLALANMSVFDGAASALLRATSSLFYGMVFAFLLNPLVCLVDKRLHPVLQKTKLPKKRAAQISRIVSILCAFVVFFLLIYTLLALMVPQLYQTIVGLVDTMPSYYANAEAWVLKILENNAELQNLVDIVMEKAYDYIEGFIHDDLLSSAQTLMVTVTSSLYGLVVGAFNMVIGMIVSVYILMSKDNLLAQSKKMVVANFQDGTADEIMEIGRRIHKIFNGFIVGKLLDSLIVGILSYIVLQIMNMPFAMLLAFIIGITNVIPYFGPFIGAIPCAILVLLVSPIQCFYFVIFILVLQQVDGNIIGPRILGDNVGIGGFWILASITVGGALFGFMGIILGVPVFASIYMIISEVVMVKLRQKGKPTETGEYFAIRATKDLEPEATEEQPTEKSEEQQ